LTVDILASENLRKHVMGPCCMRLCHGGGGGLKEKEKNGEIETERKRYLQHTDRQI